MSRIHGYDTRPELFIRSHVHQMGYRFRVHQEILPGNPDIVLAKHKKVIFIHGCFWHGHKNCCRSKRPTSNESFWRIKLDKNIERDKRQQKELKKLGWKYLIVWQCEVNNESRLKAKLAIFFSDANRDHK